MLTEKSKLIANNREISNVMNNYFAEITKHLNVKVKVICHSHPLENIIDAFKSHENIDQIKLANFHCNEVFNFCYANKEGSQRENFKSAI